MSLASVDTSIPPSGPGCPECDELDGWWVHLRRCAECGHVGCCDTSLGRHATAHFRATGHRYMRSFEPGESWYWDYVDEVTLEGPELAPPQSRPDSQTSPGPVQRVPEDWRRQLAARDRAERSGD